MTERNEVQRIGNWMRNEYPATASTLLQFVYEFDNLLTDNMAKVHEISKLREENKIFRAEAELPSEFYRAQNNGLQEQLKQDAIRYIAMQAENSKLCALLAEKYEIYLQNCAEIDRLQKANDKARDIFIGHQYAYCLEENESKWLDTYYPRESENV